MFHTPAHKSGTAGQVKVEGDPQPRKLGDVIDRIHRDERKDELMDISRQVGRVQDRVFNMDVKAHTVDQLQMARAAIMADLTAVVRRLEAIQP